MPNWKSTKESLPQNNDNCYLLHEDSQQIIGPIMWKQSENKPENGMWLDLFATSEYGECITPDQVHFWTCVTDLGLPLYQTETPPSRDTVG